MGPSGVSSSLPTGSPRKGAYPGEHRGRPRRRDGKQQANPGERAGTEPRPYRSSSGPMYLRHGPYGTNGKPHRPPWPAAQSGASAPLMQGMGGNAAKIIPPRFINLGRSLSRGLWPRQLPLHKGALPCGGRADTQVRPYTVIGVHSNARRGGTKPAPTRAPGVPICGPMQASALTEEWGIRRCFSPWNNRSPPLGAQRSVRARPGKSPGRGRKPLPGFRLRRKEAESFFPAACTAGKIPLTKRRVEEAPPQWGGASSAPKRSAMPPPAMPEGALAIVLPKGGTGQGDSKGGTSVPPLSA